MQQPPQYPYQYYQQPGPPPKKRTHPAIIALLLILMTCACIGTVVLLKGGRTATNLFTPAATVTVTATAP